LETEIVSTSFSLEDFEIPTKYFSEAPWPLVQAELRKLNNYKAPYDKFQCISTAWEIVSNCVSLVDDPGPDACFPIMSYVLYQIASKIKLFSNIHYINFFCSTLSELEDARLLAFRTVAKALLHTIKEELQKYRKGGRLRTNALLSETSAEGHLQRGSMPLSPKVSRVIEAKSDDTKRL